MGGRSGTGAGGGTAAGRVGNIAAIVERAGGILGGADYLREGMRSLEPLRAGYKGLTPQEAQQVALGNRDVVPSKWGRGRLPTPKIEINVDRNGKEFVGLIDGRHRSTVAKEAGATRIKVRVAQVKQQADGTWVDGPEVVRIVKL